MAADVHYPASGGARAAAVVSADAGFLRLVADRVALVPDVQPYRPGQFYLRELPPLRAALDGLTGMTLLVVDGFADLDPDGRPGLGAHAHAEFAVPVIGVAKSAFRAATHAVPVLREPRPARCMSRPPECLAQTLPTSFRRMAGRHRIPDALRRADTLARNGLPGAVTLTAPPITGITGRRGRSGGSTSRQEDLARSSPAGNARSPPQI